MIRRLILLSDISEEEAAAATLWCSKLCDPAFVTEHRSSPFPGRTLMFDRVTLPGEKRRASVRVMEQPCEVAERVMRHSVYAGAPVFNVYTAREDDHASAWSSTDAMFAIGLPEGASVAFFSRVGGGIAPGIAAQCLLSLAAFLPRAEWVGYKEAARHLFFKKLDAGKRRQAEMDMADLARRLLAEHAPT